MRVNIYFFVTIFMFFPFVSLYPLNTDIQPTFFLLAILVLLFAKSKLKFGGVDIIFFLLLSLSIFYQDDFYKPNLMAFIRFLFAYIAFKFFQVHHTKINSKHIFIISSIYLLTLLTHLLFPTIFTSISLNFVRDIKVLSFGVRGVSGLSPEPGFAGAIAVCIIATSFWLKDYQKDARYFRLTVFMALISVVLSRSGTGTVTLIIFLACYYSKFNFKSIICLILASIILSYVVLNVDLGRGTTALKSVWDDPIAVMHSDASIGARVLSILTSGFSLIQFPLGTGIGSFEETSTYISRNTNILNIASGSGNGKISSLSMLSYYTVELGIFWILFLIYMFAKGFYAKGVKALPFLTLAFYFILTSFSISLPVTWFLIAITHSKNNDVSKASFAL